MIKYKLIVITLLFTLFGACSNVNRESREHYKEVHDQQHFSLNNDKFRHGLVPIPYTEEPPKVSQKELDKASIARGAKLYEQHCFACHGVNADGNGPRSSKLEVKPKSLVAIAKKVPNFKLYMMVSQWKGEMPGWKSMLNQEETIDLKNYILSLAAK